MITVVETELLKNILNLGLKTVGGLIENKTQFFCQKVKKLTIHSDFSLLRNAGKRILCSHQLNPCSYKGLLGMVTPPFPSPLYPPESSKFVSYFPENIYVFEKSYGGGGLGEREK